MIDTLTKKSLTTSESLTFKLAENFDPRLFKEGGSYRQVAGAASMAWPHNGQQQLPVMRSCWGLQR